MVIESVEIENFRNYEYTKADLDSGVNIFHGDNAQGKTNFLESIYICAMAKSHRGNKDNELIKFDREESHIKLKALKKGTPVRIDIHIKHNKKKGIAINGIPVKKVSELFGILNVVIFSPEDLDIIKRSPQDRRKFIDMELCQIDKVYVNDLIKYNKVLSGRNKILKEIDFKESSKITLEILNTQLVEAGKRLIKTRQDFIKKVNQVAGKIHYEITKGLEEISIVYEPNVDPENFENELKNNYEKEYRQKVTLTGPHRDDIGFYIKDKDIRKYGSQGQQRTCALSLKLSEIEIIKNIKKENPVLLLDDVFSELDGERQKQLLKVLEENQTIITCTGTEEIIEESLKKHKDFFVKKGEFALERSKNEQYD